MNTAIRVDLRTRQALRRLLRDVLTSDIAWGYAALVLGVFLFVRWFDGTSAEAVIEAASTNLDNLRSNTVQVLLFSAFVVESPSALLLLPVLVVAYAVAQHRLGRVPLLVTIALGHLLATLFVAPLLAQGIYEGFLPRSIATVTDVGFSYGLAAVTGVLACTVPGGRRRVLYVAVVIVLWAWAVLMGPVIPAVRPSFTDMGHTIALFTGLALSTLPGAFARKELGGRDARRHSAEYMRT